MARQTALLIVCAFEILLIMFFVAWPVASSSLSEYKKEGFVGVEKCVEAMIEGAILQRVNESQSDNIYVTAFFENKIYAFTYRRDSLDHQSDCLVWLETN